MATYLHVRWNSFSVGSQDCCGLLSIYLTLVIQLAPAQVSSRKLGGDSTLKYLDPLNKIQFVIAVNGCERRGKVYVKDNSEG